MIIEIILEKKPPDCEATFSSGMNGLSIVNSLVLRGLDRLILEEISVPEPATFGMGASGATFFFSRVFAVIGMGKGGAGDFCSLAGTFLSEET